MDSFLSFLGPDNSNPLSIQEDFDVFNEDLNAIIAVWLGKYIRMCDPGYTVEEIIDKTKYLTKERLIKESFSSFFDTDSSRRSDDCEEYERVCIEVH